MYRITLFIIICFFHPLHILNAQLFALSVEIQNSCKSMAIDLLSNWDGKDGMLKGTNFDAAVHFDTLAIISKRYQELNTNEEFIFIDAGVADMGQSVFDFGPALTISPDGYVHLVTRGEGNKTTGFQLYYSIKKLGAAEWKHKNIKLSHPVPRNYAVDIEAVDSTLAFVGHTHNNTDNVGSVINMYRIVNGMIDSLGQIGTGNIIRSDADFRMKIYKDSLHLVSGYPGSTSMVFYMRAPLAGYLCSNLYSSRQILNSGTGRKGQPDIAIDNTGLVHIIYGSENSLYYHSFRNSINKSGTAIFHQLNDWHLKFGLGAVNVSPDGKNILAVALKTNNTKEAENSTLLFAISTDYGKMWTYQKSLNYRTHGGEGRMRPRILVSDSTFYTVFYNYQNDSIAVQRLSLNGLILPATPEISILPDGFSFNDTVEVSFEQAEGIISFYNFTDSKPTINSNQYTEPFKLANSTRLNTISYMPGHLPYYSTKNFDIMTNVSNVKLKASTLIHIYPNPAFEILNFSEQLNYQLYTISGFLIGAGKNKTELSMHGLSAGFYFLNTEIDGNSDMFKILKK